jgi:hypothetical protein
MTASRCETLQTPRCHPLGMLVRYNQTMTETADALSFFATHAGALRFFALLFPGIIAVAVFDLRIPGARRTWNDMGRTIIRLPGFPSRSNPVSKRTRESIFQEGYRGTAKPAPPMPTTAVPVSSVPPLPTASGK